MRRVVTQPRRTVELGRLGIEQVLNVQRERQVARQDRIGLHVVLEKQVDGVERGGDNTMKAGTQARLLRLPAVLESTLCRKMEAGTFL